jgi:hypothetical protein
MKVRLMYPDRDAGSHARPSEHDLALIQDLALDRLVAAMARGDEFLAEVGRAALLSGPENDVETIRYRQAVLQDCLGNPAAVRALYGLAVEALDHRRHPYLGVFTRYPGGILHGSIEMMELFLAMLRKVRAIADRSGSGFQSRGFQTLFATMQRELADGYFAEVEEQLGNLQFRRGVLISAELGAGNQGSGYVLRHPPPREPGWFRRLLGERLPGFTFRIHERDEVGARYLSELRDRGVHLVANALAQSADHILAFFRLLRRELGFYIGCLNLSDSLAASGLPFCQPEPLPAGSGALSARGLYDPALALQLGERLVRNPIAADGKRLIVITGANQGGKSSFLRAIGLGQVMMQCGLFVAAEAFAGELGTGVFTHFRREEDATMEKGKLDEELSRMSAIADAIGPGALLLCNESFAATNEREGSEIARQVVDACLEKRIKVCFVTHLYRFAEAYLGRGEADVLFLRAERRRDGARTHRLLPAPPLETSYGADLYREVFGGATGTLELVRSRESAS